jgi:predicted AAA+ superfamily ATPase
VLEASFIIVLLRPHFRNFGKRLVKSPKLYFLDTGLLSFLLRIRSPEDLFQHASRGAVFESFVLSEIYKNFVNRGEQPPLYFWRDSTGHEIDILIGTGTHLIPIETKSARTVAADSFDGLTTWLNLSGDEGGPAALVYGGDQSFMRRGTAVYPWFVL